MSAPSASAMSASHDNAMPAASGISLTAATAAALKDGQAVPMDADAVRPSASASVLAGQGEATDDEATAADAEGSVGGVREELPRHALVPETEEQMIERGHELERVRVVPVPMVVPADPSAPVVSEEAARMAGFMDERDVGVSNALQLPFFRSILVEMGVRQNRLTPAGEAVLRRVKCFYEDFFVMYLYLGGMTADEDVKAAWSAMKKREGRDRGRAERMAAEAAQAATAGGDAEEDSDVVMTGESRRPVTEGDSAPPADDDEELRGVVISGDEDDEAGGRRRGRVAAVGARQKIAATAALERASDRAVLVRPRIAPKAQAAPKPSTRKRRGAIDPDLVQAITAGVAAVYEAREADRARVVAEAPPKRRATPPPRPDAKRSRHDGEERDRAKRVGDGDTDHGSSSGSVGHPTGRRGRSTAQVSGAKNRAAQASSASESASVNVIPRFPWGDMDLVARSPARRK